MEFLTLMQERKRMCKTITGCADCPLQEGEVGLAKCHNTLLQYPEKAEKLIEEWAKENPEKTLKSEFLEKFPNAQLQDDEIPVSCAKAIYGNSVKCTYSCEQCWNRPISVLNTK